MASILTGWISFGIILCPAATAAAVLTWRFSAVPYLLSFASALVLFLLLFVLTAIVVPEYGYALLIASLVLILGAVRAVSHGSAVDAQKTARGVLARFFSTSQFLSLGVAGLVFVVSVALRYFWPDLQYNNNGDDAGVEKLFNFSLHQSFVFGESWPPEWIWLAGEKIRYYIFLKALPGLASWLARSLFGDPFAGGVIFILSEAFFAALTIGLMSSWISWFGRRQSRSSLDAPPLVSFVAVVLPLFCFVGTHYHAFSLGLNALWQGRAVDWWQLQEQVVPYTQNQYPMWLLMLGDNHSYTQVYWLQILLWGLVLSVAQASRHCLGLSALLGFVAGSVLLAHPASVLISLSTLLPFFGLLIWFVWKSGERARLKALLVNGGAAVLSASMVAGLLYRSPGKIVLFFPERKLLSTASDFVSLQFSVILWIVLLCIPAVLVAIVGSWRVLKSARVFSLSVFFLRFEWLIVAVIFAVVGSLVAERPALAIGSALVFFVVCCARSQSAPFAQLVSKERTEPQWHQLTTTLLAAMSFCIWILPEVVAFDNAIDSRTLWIRFQMGLRFWPEGYYLIPFATSLAMLPVLRERLTPGWRLVSWKFVVLLMVAVFSVSHIPGVRNRIERSNQEPSLDGAAYFARRHFYDGQIVQFLGRQSAEKRLVIAELCSIGDVPGVPHNYSWPGRIAAFSGRHGVCGWTWHARMWNGVLEGAGFKGMLVERKLQEFSKVFMMLLEISSPKSESSVEETAKLYRAIRSYGVTHIVVGEFERRKFPRLALAALAQFVDGRIVLSVGSEMGVIELNPDLVPVSQDLHVPGLGVGSTS